jgi:hypothetical protein
MFAAFTTGRQRSISLAMWVPGAWGGAGSMPAGPVRVAMRLKPNRFANGETFFSEGR